MLEKFELLVCLLKIIENLWNFAHILWSGRVRGFFKNHIFGVKSTSSYNKAFLLRNSQLIELLFPRESFVENIELN